MFAPVSINACLGSVVFGVAAQQLHHHLCCRVTVKDDAVETLSRGSSISQNTHRWKHNKTLLKHLFRKGSLPFLAVHQCFIYQPQKGVFLLCVEVPVNDPLTHLVSNINAGHHFCQHTLPEVVLPYLIEISGNEGDGVTSSCHLNETAVHSVPHRSVLIHPMEQITQPIKPKWSKSTSLILDPKLSIGITGVHCCEVQLLKTHSCIRREGLSPSLNFTSFSQRLSMRASCFSVSRINSRDTILFITLSTSAAGGETHQGLDSSVQNRSFTEYKWVSWEAI